MQHVLVLKGPTQEEAKRQLAEGERFCDLVEFRMDVLNEPLPTQKPVLLKSIHPLHDARFQPAWLDIDSATKTETLKKLALLAPNTKRLLSYHNFEETPKDLEKLFASIKTPFADGYKIACQATTSLDVLRLLEFAYRLQKRGEKITVVPMGEKGVPGRLVAGQMGSQFTYFAPQKEDRTAPGQLTLTQLFTYGLHKKKKQTTLFGLIGDPVDKSISHLTHNNLSKQVLYTKWCVSKEELFSFLEIAKRLPFQGWSVTAPHKQAVASLVKTREALVASNTLVKRGEDYEGYNTDGEGIAYLLRKTVQKENVAILGGGGAACGIGQALEKKGASVTYFTRKGTLRQNDKKSLQTTKQLANASFEGFTTVIQATSAPLSVPLSQGCHAIEINTFPKESPFLLEAKKRGCTYQFGFELFVEQAHQQFLLWNIPHTKEELYRLASCALAIDAEGSSIEQEVFMNKFLKNIKN